MIVAFYTGIKRRLTHICDECVFGTINKSTGKILLIATKISQKLITFFLSFFSVFFLKVNSNLRPIQKQKFTESLFNFQKGIKKRVKIFLSAIFLKIFFRSKMILLQILLLFFILYYLLNTLYSLCAFLYCFYLRAQQNCKAVQTKI